MQQMHRTDQAWIDLKGSLETDTIPAGTFLVSGASDAMTEEAQAILSVASQRKYHIRYFLCSTDGIFRVPCFLSVTEMQMQPEPLDAFHFLNQKLPEEEVSVETIVEELELMAVRKSSLPRLIVIEYLTPPGKLDLSFTLHMLQSVVSQHIPLLLLFHQQNPASAILCASPMGREMEDILSLLYLCGGRTREADWHRLIAHFPEGYDQFIASRRLGSDTWVCYASRQVAEMAANIFQAMDQERKQQLSRHVLQVLQHRTGYPLLAIASETDDQQAMLSVYSRQTVETALSEPGGLIRYLDRLRLVAQTGGDARGSNAAYIIGLSARILHNDVQAVQVYKRLHGVLPDITSTNAQVAFWKALGQVLVIQKHPEAWEYAAECFQLGKECLKRVHQRNSGEFLSFQAGIANGEALIAYNLHQYEKAQRLEEFVLARAKLFANGASMLFNVHVLTNLGDVLLRLPDKREDALACYGEALLLSIQAFKMFKHQLTLEDVLFYRQRAALKLGKTLMESERYEEAIQILESLMSDLTQVTDPSWIAQRYTPMLLKVRLTLAEAYLKTGQERKAALCYWSILRYPYWLDVATLRDVATRLCACRPDMHERLRRWIERVVSEQEMLLVDVMQIQEIFTETQSNLEEAMVA